MNQTTTEKSDDLKSTDFIDEGAFVPPDKPSIYLLVGKPRSGKSHTIKHLLYKYFKKGYFKFGLVVSPTSFTGSYDYLPEKCLWKKFDEEKFKQYLQSIDQVQTLAKNGKGKPVDPSFLIFDDCLGMINWQSEVLQNFIACFRHYNITCFISAQYLKGSHASSTLLRSCLTYCFAFYSADKNSIEALYQMCGQSTGMKYPEFCQFFLGIVDQEYHCLLYVNEGRDNRKKYLDFVCDKENPKFTIKF
jgi:Poxvirus A32 protein